MKEMILTNKNQLDAILDSGNCIVYGAGMVSKRIIKYANYRRGRIDKILVTEKTGNPAEINGIPVEGIAHFCNIGNKQLLVCVMENKHEDIRERILGLNFEMVYFVSDDLYWQIKSIVANYKMYGKNDVYDVKRDGYLWNNICERKMLLENWGEVSSREGYSEKYINLIRGMDEDSIEVIARVLKRLEVVLNVREERIDLYSEEEKKKLSVLDEKFTNLIIKLHDNLYAYKKYLLPIRHFEPSVFFYKHGIEKVTHIEKLKGKVILDVGGYIGDSAIVLSELSPSKIFSFEAIPKHIELMKKTIELNEIENVIPVNCALGKQKGILEMGVSGSASASVDRKGILYDKKIECVVVSLDEYVKENNIEDIGLIKVDIEGGESDFLAGAKETICKYKPVLLLSIYHNAHDFFELKPILESWNLGYKFSVYKPVDDTIACEILLIAQL